MLNLVAPNILIFLNWQAAFSGILSISLGVSVWKVMPKNKARPCFDPVLLRSVMRFAAGTFVIGITTSLLTQADKLIVSKYVSLGDFSAYSITFTLVTQISSVVLAPISMTVQPYLAGLMIDAPRSKVAYEYHRWSQIQTFVTLCVLGTVLFFARPILQLWLGTDSSLVNSITPLVPFVALGSILNSLVAMPFICQMAAGWVRLSLVKNLVALTLFLPMLFIFVPRYGMQVGAVLWLLLNLSYYVFEPLFLHRRFLRNELAAWWLFDTFVPGLLAMVVFWCSGRLIPTTDNPWLGLGHAALSSLVVALILIACMPKVRQTLASGIAAIRSTY